MIPGALLGMAVALISRRPEWIRRTPVFGMADALGFALGGTMSYGRIIGYTKGIHLLDATYGYLMLGVVGGLWGAFGAACIGMVASRKRYHVFEVIVFVLVAAGVGMALHVLLVKLLGLHMTPPRGDSWPQCLGACLVLLGLCWYKRDRLPARFMFWGLAGGSFGFMIGESFQVYGSFLGPAYNWWKVMEQSFGFILGLGVAYGAHRECRNVETGPSPPYPVWVFALCVTAWLVPVVTMADTLSHWSGKAGVVDTSEDGVNTLLHFHIRHLALLALLVLAAWWYERRRGCAIDPVLGAKALFAWVMWSCLMIGVLKMSLPQWYWTGLWVHNGFFAMAVGLTIWLVLGIEPRSEFDVRPHSRHGRRLLELIPIYIVAFLVMALALAATSIATHPGQWRSDAHRRFGGDPVRTEQRQRLKFQLLQRKTSSFELDNQGLSLVIQSITAIQRQELHTALVDSRLRGYRY